MEDILFDKDPPEIPEAAKASDYLVDVSSAGRGLTGLTPTISPKVDALAQSYQLKFGEPLKLVSAQRTFEHQSRLYEADVAAHGGVPSGYVAKPGSSSHETGMAFDIDKGQAAKIPDAVLHELGLHRPLKGQGKSGVNEPWHIQELPAEGVPAGQKKWQPDELKVLADQKADQYGIPRDIFRALIGHESQWKPDAANPTSSALGLGQFLDSTNEDYKLGLNIVPRGKGGPAHPDDERLHPDKALDAAARLLLAKPGATWADRVKNYGEGTDAYLAKVMKQWEVDQKTPPSNNEIRLASGLPMEATPPAPLSVGEYIKGGLEVGSRQALQRMVNVGMAVGPVANDLGLPIETPSGPVDADFRAKVRRAVEDATVGEAGRAVEEQPPTSLTGKLGMMLVESVPELPAFMAAGTLTGGVLAAGSKLPYVGSAIGKVASYVSPEAIKGASIVGSLPRLALRDAMTGGILGATTAASGERLQQAGEEAFGFAIAGPAFHLAGKALFGLAKGVGKKIVGIPPNFSARSEAEAKFENISEPLSFLSARKAAKAEGVELIRVDGKWHTGERIGGAEPPKVDIPASDITGPTFASSWEANAAREQANFPSGAKADVVQHPDGTASLVPDYSVQPDVSGIRKIAEGKSKARGLPAEELGKMFPEPTADTGTADILAEAPGAQASRESVQKALDMAKGIFGEAPAEVAPAKPKTLVEEVQEAQGGKREVPSRANVLEDPRTGRINQGQEQHMAALERDAPEPTRKVEVHHVGTYTGGEIDQGKLLKGEGAGILGPGVYFSDKLDISNLYGKYTESPQTLTRKVNLANFFDPIQGTPGLMQKMREVKREAGIFEPVKGVRQFDHGRGGIGEVVKTVGPERARELFIKHGIYGAREKLPGGAWELSVFSPKAFIEGESAPLRLDLNEAGVPVGATKPRSAVERRRIKLEEENARAAA
jgi:hypothetical protein